MRAFSDDLERRAYDHGRRRDWVSWRLLAEDKSDAAAAAAGEPPVQAAWPLRLLLFGFGALVLGAFSLIFLKDSAARSVSSLAALVLATASVAVAETSIAKLGVRRFGFEEACVAGACVLVAYAFERLTPGESRWRFADGTFSLVLALSCVAAYVRYGYRLAGLGLLVAAGWFVTSWDQPGIVTRFSLAALYASVLAYLMSRPEEPRRERDRLELARFLTALAVPLCLNERLDRLLDGPHAWMPPASFGAREAFTLALVFLVPAAWVAWAARARSRPLLWAGALGIVIAQCSVKPYLGIKRNSWDPATLGVELVVVALVLKRWLDAGPGRRRGAFSSESLGSPEPGGALAWFAAAATAAAPSAPAHDKGAFKGGGGGFGGGGASGSF